MKVLMEFGRLLKIRRGIGSHQIQISAVKPRSKLFWKQSL